MSGVVWSKFFWSDWQADPALRLCSYAARGLWIDMLCIAAVHDPIGYVAVAGRGLAETDIARMTGGSESEVRVLLSELEQNGVFSRDRKGMIFSRRMLRDAKKCAMARKNGKKGGNPTLSNQTTISPSDNQKDKAEDKPQEPLSNNHDPTRSSERDKSLSADTPLEKQVFDAGKAVLGKQSGGLIAKLRKELRDDGRLLELIQLSREKSDPREFLVACVKNANCANWPKPDHHGRIRDQVDAKTLFVMGAALVGDGSDELVRGLMDAFDGKLAKAAEILLLRAQRPPEWWEKIVYAVRYGEEIDAPSDIYPDHSYR